MSLVQLLFGFLVLLGGRPSHQQFGYILAGSNSLARRMRTISSNKVGNPAFK